MEQIGVRELRQHASRWLDRVRAGESFEVTDRGHPVAMLVPATNDAWERLRSAGLVANAADADRDVTRVRLVRGPDLSTALRQLRDDER